jgi:hypothetical protein
VGDLGGIALAAIQGLGRELKDRNAQLAGLVERNAELEARLARLERLLN